jgi:hypothetical protein
MNSRFVPLLLGVAAAVVFVTSSFIDHLPPQAQESEDATEDTQVTEPDLALYIEVYEAMQADHGLTIQDALARAGNKMDLDQFRELERRIQRSEGLVTRVRQALLEQAKARAGTVEPTPPPNASAPH